MQTAVALTHERRFRSNQAILICEHLLVPFVGGETDGHLGNDARKDSPKTLVKTQCSLALYNLGTSLQETTLWCLRARLEAVSRDA